MPSAFDLAKKVCQRFPDLTAPPLEFRGEVTVCVTKAASITDVMRYARSELSFDILLDISSVDNMGNDPRFEIVYHLYSFASHVYLRIKTCVGEETPELPSVTNVWKAADWHEREIFDMMGIRFTGHPDLRRILMWDSYPYHPLRKDFPLSGISSPDNRAKPAPLAGGPFVTSPGEKTTVEREPRAKGETDSVV